MVGRLTWVLVLVLALGLGSVASNSWSEDGEESVINSSFRVEPGRFYAHPVRISKPLKEARIAGNASAAGGAGNDIRVMLMSETQFETLTRKPLATGVYDSGKRRSVVMSVPIETPGTFYLVFDNRFSPMSPKQVTAEIRLVHGGVDTERAETAKRQATERERRVGQILGRLVTALRQVEKKLGTRQVSGPVYFGIPNDPSLNAGAYWQKRYITVNRGVIELAESMPSPREGDSLLAGVLGHEIAHIFYRHAHGNESVQTEQAATAGLTGALMIHPLAGLVVGLLSYDSQKQYDRRQEAEADVLGIRLACVAGYDPNGLLVFMAQVDARHRGTGGFLASHPAPQQRVNYLEGEVTKLSGCSSQS